MPYARKKMYRKRAYKKGSKLNPRQKKEIKQIINKQIELKSYDVSVAGSASMDINGRVDKWFTIPYGAQPGQRVGDDIEVAYIQFKYDCQLADPFNRCRVIIFQWRLDDTTPPVVSDILATASGAVPWNALYNFANRDRYSILHDKRFILEASSTGTGSLPFTSPTYTVKPKHKKLLYNTGASTGRYMIYTLSCSDSTTISHPSIVITPRIVYRDA